MDPFATYVLRDPSSGKIRYIGKTKQSLAGRLTRHIRDAREVTPQGRWVDRTHRANWIRSLLAGGLMPEILEICRYRTLNEVNEAERFLIKHFRAVRSDLTNATDGGDGGIVPRKPVVADDIVIAAYRNGMSSKKIAAHFHTCGKRVLRLVKEAGMTRPSGRGKA